MKEILSRVDHTLLSVTATTRDYLKLCDEGIQFNVASVCVPPSRVSLCANHAAGKIAICTVIGFPNGYADPDAKAHEAQLAIQSGATEIDMVIDIGNAKEHNYPAILADIKKVRAATPNQVLKVIIETALLTEEEKIALCNVVGESGADYIKTSTGFAPTGATFQDIALLRKHSPPHTKIKAAGGISTLEDAKKFIELGADRLGTSRIIKLIQGLEGAGY